MNRFRFSPLQELSRRTVSLVERAKMTEHTFMIVVALIIGALGGFGAILIRAMIKWISTHSFPGPGTLLENMTATPWWLKILVPALGGLIVGPLIFFFAREAKGHGVPEVMQAILLRGGMIRPRVAVVKALASAISIGSGGSVGREGPIVQIGSSIGSSIGQFFKVSNQRLKTFVGCGAAAGIAAAFNAPIAGALFSVEIILQDFAFAQFSPIVISSVMATVISHHFEGNFAAFQVPEYHLSSPLELVFYFGLAVVSAVVGYVFIRVLYFFEDVFDRRLHLPEYLKPLLGGALIGVIAIGFPQVMGVGYESINNALHGKMIWHLAAILIFVKLLATSITLGSGGSGGIFAPSLFLGAMTGMFFGFVVNLVFPMTASDPGAYALVAMGGLVSATTHAPITAIIIVFELTNDYQIILPLMITCIVSTIIATKLGRESIYTLKLLKRNIHLKDGAEINIMKSIFVKEIYQPTSDSIAEDATFDAVVQAVISSRNPCIPVVAPRGRLSGLISIEDIKEYLYDIDMLQNLLIARDIANRDLIAARLEDDCQSVVEKMSLHDLPGIPVVDPDKDNLLLGMIWHRDILDAYRREVENRDVASLFASRITMKREERNVHFLEGYSLTEIPAPAAFVGKSIKELDVRAAYGVDILLVRERSTNRLNPMPGSDYVFREGDAIVVAGEIGKINLVKSL